MRYASLAAAVGLLFSAGLAMAGTKVQGNLVDPDVGNPTVDAKSKFKLSGKGAYQFGLKGITDAGGMPAAVTTPGRRVHCDHQGRRGRRRSLGVQHPCSHHEGGSGQGEGERGADHAGPGRQRRRGPGRRSHEPPTAGTAAACTTIMTDMLLPGVYLGPSGGNPCTSGARVAVGGVVTEAP